MKKKKKKKKWEELSVDTDPPRNNVYGCSYENSKVLTQQVILICHINNGWNAQSGGE